MLIEIIKARQLMRLEVDVQPNSKMGEIFFISTNASVIFAVVSIFSIVWYSVIQTTVERE